MVLFRNTTSAKKINFVRLCVLDLRPAYLVGECKIASCMGAIQKVKK